MVQLFYPLLSLKLFKELVKYEIEFEEKKNNHVPERVIEALGLPTTKLYASSWITNNKVIELFPTENIQNIIIDDNKSNNLSLKEELDLADKQLDSDEAEIINLNHE